MSTVWRIALAWMLALALPLQGHAAQRLAACMGAPALPSAQAPHPVFGVHLQARPLHEGLAEAHDSHCDAEQGDVATDAPRHGACSGCSSCAACCHAVALLPTAPPLPLMPEELPVAAVARVALVHVWLDTLERPPRSSMR
ncbi:hypothetical protein ACS5PK_07350 [Roseateles sp. DB2]|uniref:hypothetical protein n=1 Tax=Roseateles sp. DB2 TaxID=3453717 RepID=UPI003EEB509B